MKITFEQLKKYICESVDSIYDQYEDILCEIFDVNDISEIKELDYKDMIYAYQHNQLNEHDVTLLEDAAILVHKVASQNGYNIVAHHGTGKKFSEFQYGDIGFHLGSLEQAKIAASWHTEYADKETIYLNTAISLHHPLVIKDDLGEWEPSSIVSGAFVFIEDFIEDKLHNKYGNKEINVYHRELLEDTKLLNYVESEINKEHFKYDQSKYDSKAQFCFLHNSLGYSVYEILNLYHMMPYNIKREILNRLKSLGFDGIKYLNLYEVENFSTDYHFSYIVFDANQIKNCEVISFKDGKVVPLENRFNSNTNNLFENK